MNELKILNHTRVSIDQDYRSHRPTGEVQTCPFGIRALDLATGGIMKNDVVVMSARTGGGKTEFAVNVAMANLRRGKRVLFFALEASSGEIANRIAYQEFSHRYYMSAIKRDIPDAATMRYKDFVLGKLKKTLEPYEDDVADKLSEFKDRFHVIYREKEFKIDDFEKCLLAYQDDVDLVIVDHLAYFDLDDAKNENAEFTRVVKGMRDMALLSGKPILLLTHIRKKDRKDESLVPDVDDLFGTSNVAKIATKIIMIAPDYVNQQASHTEYGTYIHIAKDRTDGSLPRYLFRVVFDIKTNSYHEQFAIGKHKPMSSDFEPLILGDYPKWIPKKS